MDQNSENKDHLNEEILDVSVFGQKKLFSCTVQKCEQKFTNKLKITLHWARNHAYKLCNLCSNYAFLYDSDKIQHERQHLPFGCSTCNHEFTSVSYDDILIHYKKNHKSFLCFYCSSVIDPLSKYPEHIMKKHNFLNYSESINTKELFELIGDPENGFFRCKMCDKKKRLNLLFGHYVFYHLLSVQALNDCLSSDEQMYKVHINGASLNEVEDVAIETGSCNKRIANKKDVCSVCEKCINSDSNVHDVFCLGLVICKQKECSQLFENSNDLVRHLNDEHPIRACNFGCRETKLKATEIDEHLQKSHDIIECSLCSIITGSGNFKNHLRDKHSVNLMIYEKATAQTSSKLYRVEKVFKPNAQVLCNLCDFDLTKDIREFSFLSHYQNQHEVDSTSILRNLDKNPMIDVMTREKVPKTDEDYLKNFSIVVQKETDVLVEFDFDTSKVCCILPSDMHIEQKPQLSSISQSSISCDFCEQTAFDATCRLYEHMILHGFKLHNFNDQCETCNAKNLVELHQVKDELLNILLVCPTCRINFETPDNFKNHMSNEHDEVLAVNTIMYKCFECSFTYYSIPEIRKHFNEDHPDLVMNYCTICRNLLTDSKEKAVHFDQNHSDVGIKEVKMYSCNICEQCFMTKYSAKVHYNKHHRKKEMNRKSSFKCLYKLCNEGFESKEDRKMHHMIVHPDEKMFSCKSCPLKFATKSSLCSHNVIHKNVVNTCQHCKKTFIRRDSFKEHLLIHSGVRQKCSFCDKSFVQRSNLIRHERIHLNDKPYKCNYCEKTFSDKGACNSHEKVHTKAEHSNCEVCGKHFARKQKLKYHMRIHTLENVLTCECGKIFTESYSFRKHRETHLKKGRSDKCYECGKLFKSAKMKDQHMLMAHNLPEEESLIETKIQCTLCNLKDFTMETIKTHLKDVHNTEEASDWTSYIDEVEFKMENF